MLLYFCFYAKFAEIRLLGPTANDLTANELRSVLLKAVKTM